MEPFCACDWLAADAINGRGRADVKHPSWLSERGEPKQVVPFSFP